MPFATTPTNAPATPAVDPGLDALLRTGAQLARDARLFIATAFAAHASVVINLVAVLQ